jgi:hypothetical protein
MSVTMNWSKGKLMIRNNLLHYYDTLHHKDLTTSELKYIICTVIASQALYYLNVTPLTDSELTSLDNKWHVCGNAALEQSREPQPPMLRSFWLELPQPCGGQ